MSRMTAFRRLSIPAAAARIPVSALRVAAHFAQFLVGQGDIRTQLASTSSRFKIGERAGQLLHQVLRGSQQKERQARG